MLNPLRALCCSLLLLLPAAFAGPAAPRQEAPTQASVEAAIAQLGLMEGVDDAVRSRAEDSYRQALAQLLLAETSEERRAGFERERLDGPRVMAAVQLELDRADQAVELPIEWATPLADVEREVALAQAQLEAVRAEAAGLDEEPTRRAARRAELPLRQVALRAELEAVAAELSATPAEGVTEVERTARRTYLVAHQLALLAEDAAAQEELHSYESRSELLAARRALVTRRLSEAQRLVDAWAAAADERRQRETRRAQREADAAELKAAAAPVALREAAARAAAHARARADLVRRIEETAVLHVETKAELTRVRDSAASARQREEAAGLTEVVGILLRKQRADLPRARDYRRRIDLLQRDMGDLRLAQIALAEERDDFADEDRAVEALLADLELPTGELEALRPAALDLVRDERRLVKALLADHDRQLIQLQALAADEAAVVAEVETFRTYIEERILWIRSAAPLWGADWGAAGEALLWIVSPANWTAVATGGLQDLNDDPLGVAGAFVVLLALARARRGARGRLAACAVEARKRTCVRIRPTFQGLGASLVLAGFVPAILGLVAWRLGEQLGENDFPKALSGALGHAALVLFLLQLVRLLWREDGLGPAHFGWSGERGAALRASLAGLAVSALPAYAVAMLMEGHAVDPWRQSLGRVALVSALAIYAAYVARVGPAQGRAAAGSLLSDRARRVLQVLGVGVPAILALMAVAGWYFTTLELVDRLVTSLMLLVGLLLVHDLVGRWLLVARRRLAIDQARRRFEAARASEDERAILDTDKLDLDAIDHQSRQMLRFTVWVALALLGWVVWNDVLPALGLLDQVQLYSYWATETVADGGVRSVEVVVSLGRLLLALLIFAGTLLAGRNLPGAVEVLALRGTKLGSGERYAIGAITRYVVLLIGFVWSFGELGVGWSQVQWLAAAMSVGLGFGLQEIFANFVSGLILLLERPIRVGDWVTVGTITGRVSRIQMRATTVLDLDRKELIVPNREFVTGQLVNWSLSDPITRMTLPVGVAYGSDTELASRVLLELAAAEPLVLDEPKSDVVFTSFGDSTLDLHLRVFLSERDDYPAVKHALNTAIHKRFAQEGIEIAFPQRDLHIRSASGLEGLLGGDRRPGTA